MKLSQNAKAILKYRYLKRNSKGKVVETPKQMFKRVADNVAKVEKSGRRKLSKQFYHMMSDLDFLPNSPTLFNAGRELQQLSACFVLPIKDDLHSIFMAMHDAALIHQSGGGTGYNFSAIRPKGDIVTSTTGKASGPLSFIKVFDAATEQIKQGGKRRGANMAILDVSHPDIEEFIFSKEKEGVLTNFNISVGITDKFMKAVCKNKKFGLVNPRNGKTVRRVRARTLYNKLCSSAWKNADPGVVFLDEINRKHVLKQKIKATNPCGEQPLLDYESCNLGSINLSNFVKSGSVEWERLGKTVDIAVHFLDNVIDASHFPLEKIKQRVEETRKIGLGVMGFADMLIQLKVPYASEKALALAEEVMKFINETAHRKSVELGKIKGCYEGGKRRNATLTTIAPTGTLSIIADCSSGIEPLFALTYQRSVVGGKRMREINKHFLRYAKSKGLSKSVVDEVKRTGKYGVDIFKTATEILPEWHVKMQASFQKHTDNAVSKTINMPEKAKVSDVKTAFFMAWKLGCKGTTVYRTGSRKEQVLTFGCECS